MKEAKLMAGEVLERWPEPTSLHALVERLFVELFRYGSLSAIAFHFDFSLGVLELHWRTIPDTNAAPSLDVKDWLTNCCTRTVLAASSLRIEGVFAHRPIIRRQLEAQAGRLASELLSTVLRPWAALYVNVSWEVALMGSGTLAFARHFRWDNPNDEAASEQPWLHRMRQLLNETAAVVRFSTHVIAGNLPASPMPSRSASGEWHLALVPAAQRVLETLACRHAIMFGDRLDLAACQQLLKRLSKCRLPFQCAHGRPSVAALSCPRRPR
jgi:hypothetical protein